MRRMYTIALVCIGIGIVTFCVRMCGMSGPQPQNWNVDAFPAAEDFQRIENNLIHFRSATYEIEDVNRGNSMPLERTMVTMIRDINIVTDAVQRQHKEASACVSEAVSRVSRIYQFLLSRSDSWGSRWWRFWGYCPYIDHPTNALQLLNAGVGATFQIDDCVSSMAADLTRLEKHLAAYEIVMNDSEATLRREGKRLRQGWTWELRKFFNMKDVPRVQQVADELRIVHRMQKATTRARGFLFRRAGLAITAYSSLCREVQGQIGKDRDCFTATDVNGSSDFRPGCDDPGRITFDHFNSVRRLEANPYFDDINVP